MKPLVRVAVAGLVAVSLGVALWELRHLLVDPHHRLTNLSAADRLKAENDVRVTIVQALAGSGIIVGLYFSARTLRLGTGSLKVSADTLALNRDNELVDRFSKAVDQLGSTSADVRMGAVYSLERVARDSPSDHPTVMEVLSAYLREHTRLPGASHGDLHAAATVIGRRKVDQDPPGWILNLDFVDMRGFNLRGAQLMGARLEGAQLQGAYLDGARLEDARATRASLQDARLVDAHLERIDLTRAHLERATLTGAYLQQAHFEGAHLESAVLLGVRAREAVFTRANLEGVIIDGADTQGAVDLTVP